MREHGPKIRRWLGVGSAVAVICAGVSMSTAQAQTSSDGSKTAASKTKSQAVSNKKAGSSKKSAKGAAASQSASKSHSASVGHSKSKTTVARNGHTTLGKGKKKTARGQQKIDPERAEEIQEALIREHYLSGEAAGSWNEASEAAMRRYQADHGWQSKTVPDSRALISLGLGPSHDHLLNPESAMVTGPFPTRSATLTPVSHSAGPDVQSSAPSANAPATAVRSDDNGPNSQ